MKSKHLENIEVMIKWLLKNDCKLDMNQFTFDKDVELINNQTVHHMNCGTMGCIVGHSTHVLSHLIEPERHFDYKGDFAYPQWMTDTFGYAYFSHGYDLMFDYRWSESRHDAAFRMMYWVMMESSPIWIEKAKNPDRFDAIIKMINPDLYEQVQGELTYLVPGYASDIGQFEDWKKALKDFDKESYSMTTVALTISTLREMLEDADGKSLAIEPYTQEGFENSVLIRSISKELERMQKHLETASDTLESEDSPEMVKSRQRIAAIEYFRNRTGCSLHEAKEMVDGICERPNKIGES